MCCPLRRPPSPDYGVGWATELPPASRAAWLFHIRLPSYPKGSSCPSQGRGAPPGQHMPWPGLAHPSPCHEDQSSLIPPWAQLAEPCPAENAARVPSPGPPGASRKQPRAMAMVRMACAQEAAWGTWAWSSGSSHGAARHTLPHPASHSAPVASCTIPDAPEAADPSQRPARDVRPGPSSAQAFLESRHRSRLGTATGPWAAWARPADGAGRPGAHPAPAPCTCG